MSEVFTLEELLAELEKSSATTDESYRTAAEWRAIFNVGDNKMRRILSAAKRSNRLLVSRTERETIIGTRGIVPVYAFILDTKVGEICLDGYEQD